MQALTDPAFWDDYWSTLHLPALVEPRVQWYGALTRILRAQLPPDPTLSLFEVGCAPGRWLIWFHQTFGYQVAGCDTAPRGVALTQENLTLNGVAGQVYAEDLMSAALPRHAFDLVLSLGVIEHFTDPRPIVARHLELLKPGGRLILEVPNMAGALNLKLLRAAHMEPFLNAHNLRVMQRSYFHSLAEDFPLAIQYLDYLGGFDPGMVVHNQPYRSRRGRPPILYALSLLERLTRRAPSVSPRLNGPAFSNMLLGIYTYLG